MKGKRIVSLLLTLLLMVGTSASALAADTAATMQLSATEGTVTVTNASGRTLSLMNNMRLYSGYQVSTGAKSYAWINLDSSKLIKLDANSSAQIRKSGSKLEVLLQSGNLYGNVSKPLSSGETLDIRTSTAIVGIRGTKFSVAQVRPARPDGQADAEERWTTRVQVYEGAVAVKTRQETPATPETPPATVTTTITAGNQLVVDPGAAETEVFTETPLAAEDISGAAAVELVKDPATLEDLGMGLPPENAQELLERDQAQAEEKQAEADAAKTGLENAAGPSIVWDGASETPSGGGGSGGGGSGGGGGGGSTPPDPVPATCTVRFMIDAQTEFSSSTVQENSVLANGPDPGPEMSGFRFTGWYTDANCTARYDFTAPVTGDLTLYAGWESLPAYTVTFDPNGGLFGSDKTPQSVTTEPGGQLASGSVPADPVLDGSAFTGWNTAADGSGTTIDPASYTFTADASLYAQWTPLPTYTVTFDPNGGTLTGDNTAVTSVEGKLSTLPTPTPRNANTDATASYTFNGWYTAAEGGTEVTADTTFSANATVYAHWTMDSGWDWALNNGALRIFGTGIVMESVGNPPWVDSASIITSVTVEEGITGIGQMVFVGCSSLPSITLPQSITSIGSYAFQDCNKLANVSFSGTPTFEKLGLGMNVFLNCTALTSFTVPSGVIEVQQYTFSGCTSLTAVAIPASATAVSAEAFDGCTGLTEITFGGTKAQWNAFSYKAPDDVTVTCSDGILPEYAVTFDSKGGSAVASQTVDKGGKATKPADPTRTDYTFGGWSLDGATAYDFSTPVTGNITLTALWTPLLTYTVTFDALYGNWVDGTAEKTVQVKVGETVTEPDPNPTRKGYNFTQWLLSNAGYDFTTPVTGDITLYAGWAAIQCTVIFDATGGKWWWDTEYNATSSKTVNQYAGLDKPTNPAYPGHTFLGWYTEPECINEFVFAVGSTPGTPITEDMTLYAKWTVNTYTVTFNTDGGSAVDSLTVSYGSTVTKPTDPTKTSKVFYGWYTDQTYQTEFSFDTPVTQDVTVYALWMNYSVTFDTNGGIGGATLMVDDSGVLTDLPNPPSYSGKTFSGWNTAADGSGTPISQDALSTYKFTENTTLYAQWN